jgi:hypothetical protein
MCSTAALGCVEQLTQPRAAVLQGIGPHGRGRLCYSYRSLATALLRDRVAGEKVFVESIVKEPGAERDFERHLS